MVQKSSRNANRVHVVGMTVISSDSWWFQGSKLHSWPLPDLGLENRRARLCQVALGPLDVILRTSLKNDQGTMIGNQPIGQLPLTAMPNHPPHQVAGSVKAHEALDGPPMLRPRGPNIEVSEGLPKQVPRGKYHL